MGPKGAGDLTEVVRFERRRAETDGYGNTQGAWEVLIPRRSASLKPTRGGDQVIAARAQGVVPHDLWVSFDSETRAVTTDDRVVDVNDSRRTFKILAIPGDMDGRRDWLLMQLELGRSDG